MSKDWDSDDGRYKLRTIDALVGLSELPDASVDVIFADPPYFLSGGGTTCKAGERASVNKGTWDEPRSPEEQLEWTRDWLVEAKRVLKPAGTIWVSGTLHSIHAVGMAIQLEGLRILNEIAWIKGNPPPNLACRTFTHSHETIIWASLGRRAKHHYDYLAMKADNGDKQMKDAWHFNAPGQTEKSSARHPTQKPIALLDRCLRASLPEGGTVVDPFMGSGTTGVAAASRPERNWRFIGFDIDPQWLYFAQSRILNQERRNAEARRKAAFDRELCISFSRGLRMRTKAG
jgi:site-specific DNA-methyltransferase (adenine-specific)